MEVARTVTHYAYACLQCFENIQTRKFWDVGKEWTHPSKGVCFDMNERLL
jgi:hypothetical protein